MKQFDKVSALRVSMQIGIDALGAHGQFDLVREALLLLGKDEPVIDSRSFAWTALLVALYERYTENVTLGISALRQMLSRNKFNEYVRSGTLSILHLLDDLGSENTNDPEVYSSVAITTFERIDQFRREYWSYHLDSPNGLDWWRNSLHSLIVAANPALLSGLVTRTEVSGCRKCQATQSGRETCPTSTMHRKEGEQASTLINKVKIVERRVYHKGNDYIYFVSLPKGMNIENHYFTSVKSMKRFIDLRDHDIIILYNGDEDEVYGYAYPEELHDD